MNRRLQILALMLWFVSLALPTLINQKGGFVLGYDVLKIGAMGALLIPFSLAFPGHLLSLASNFLVLREIFYLVSPVRTKEEQASLAVLVIAFALNLSMGLFTLGDANAPLRGILKLPGYYVWLTSFFVLIVARVVGSAAKELG